MVAAFSTSAIPIEKRKLATSARQHWKRRNLLVRCVGFRTQKRKSDSRRPSTARGRHGPARLITVRRR